MIRSILAAALLATAAVAPANAAQTLSSEFVIVTDLGGGQYSFIQSGFDEGASVIGSFTGFDLDEDLQLSAFAGEISNFTAFFSGNSLVSAYSFDNGVLVFDLNGSNLLGDGTTGGTEGIAANYFVPGATQWAAGPGPFALCGTGQSCGVVTGGTVPEPASWALLLAGFGLTGAALRRRKAALA